MKKKILLIILIIVGVFTITGCGNNSKNTSKENTLGDTVKTDRISFKLIASKYTYALVNSNNDEFATPKEYDANEDNNNPYVASKGHTLAAFTFCLENLDRASVDIGGFSNSDFTVVKYDNETYGHSSESKTIFKATSDDNLTWKKYDSSNILIKAGEKKYFRAYIDIPVDIKNLDEKIELIVKLPNSEDKTDSYTYIVSKEDRNYKEEIPEEVAIKNYDKKVVREYFAENKDKYSTLKADEIKSTIEGKKYNVVSYSNGTWKGTFTFENSGKIYEGGNSYAIGYVNKRTWAISGDNLNLSWVTSKGETKTTSYEVRKVKDGVYLLLSDNDASGILY